MRERFGLAQCFEHAVEISERVQRTAQLEPQINRPLNGYLRLGQSLEGIQRLFEKVNRFLVRGACQRPVTGLLEVVVSLFPKLTSNRVMPIRWASSPRSPVSSR